MARLFGTGWEVIEGRLLTSFVRQLQPTQHMLFVAYIGGQGEAALSAERRLPAAAARRHRRGWRGGRPGGSKQ